MQRSTTDQIHNYDLKKRIGTGTYGKVFKALRKSDGKIVAVKIVDIAKMDKAGIESVLNEVRILSSISNSYIVEYYEAFVDPCETQFWIIMEFLGGGDLANAIKASQKQNIRINERQIWSYMIQILKGVLDLHKLKIVHRDIKPANIFLTEDYKHVKIGDMNVSKVLKQDLTKTQIGTPYYLAPEIWNKKSYDYKADVFSLGALVYELAALKHPYEAKNTSELHRKILNESIPRLPTYYSEDLNYIVMKCLTKDPQKRPNVEQLLDSKTVQMKIKELNLESYLTETEDPGILLETIIAPKKLSMLNKRLPKKGMVRSQSVKDYNSNGTNMTEELTNDSLRVQKTARGVVKDIFPKPADGSRKSYKDIVHRNSSREVMSRRGSRDALVRPSSKDPNAGRPSSREVPVVRPSSREPPLVRPSSREQINPKQSPIIKPVQSEKAYQRLSVDKKQDASKNAVLAKKNSITNLQRRPPMMPTPKLNKDPPLLQKFQSEGPSDSKRLIVEKNNPPMRLPKNNSGLFAKKFVSHRVDQEDVQVDNKLLGSKNEKVSTPNSRYQSPRALKYADYINKMAEKDVKPKIQAKAPSIKRSNSSNRNFVI